MLNLASPTRSATRWRSRLALAAAVASCAAVPALAPAAASAITVGNPQVMTINPTTGVQNVLNGGKPWNTLGGIAVNSAGTVYVANQAAPGPNPIGNGIYALSPSGYGMVPFATSTPTSYPAGLTLSGTTLYSLDQDRVIATNTLTGAQTVVSSGGLYDQYGVQPTWGALSLSGNTLYTTAWGSCDSVAGGGAYVIAVNLSTGQQTLTKSLGCAQIGGIAVTKTGQLLIAESDGNTLADNVPTAGAILQLNPGNGLVSMVTSGGDIVTPQGIVLDAAGDLLVADSTTGVVAVSLPDGEQSPISSGGRLGGANGIAVGASGLIYVSEAGAPPVLSASAVRSQRFTPYGIKIGAACSRLCTVAYDIQISGVSPSYAQSSAFHNIGTVTSARRVKLPTQVNRRIATALNQRKVVIARLTLTPQDPNTGAPGKPVTLAVRLTKH